MNPTKQQINQAERLQAAGLCQESDKWMIEMKDRSFQIHVGNLKDWTFNPERGKYELCKRVVGPIPTFEEVLVDFKPIFDIVDNARYGLQFLIHSHGVTLGYWKLDPIGEWKWLDGFTITTAVIEALLLLKGEG